MAESTESYRRTLLLYGRTGPWRLESSYARAFRDLGWSVETVDAGPDGDELTWWLRSRLGRRLTRSSIFLRRRGARRRNERFRDRVLACSPDLVFLINGTFLMPETVAAVRDEGIPVAVFYPDAPVPGNANHRPEHLPIAREASRCFIWSRVLGERLEEAGARRVSYLPFAWDQKVFPHTGYSPEDGPEVVFVGGWDRHRERWLEPVAARFELEIWGPDYWTERTRRGSLLRDCWQGRPLRGEEAAATVSSAAISLNVLREQNLPDGTNMRTFEVPGAGGFSFATRTSGAMEIYPEAEAGAYFSSVDELIEGIDRHLSRPEERRAMARRAHDITVKGHRYAHRARRILNSLDAYGDPQEPPAALDE